MFGLHSRKGLCKCLTGIFVWVAVTVVYLHLRNVGSDNISEQRRNALFHTDQVKNIPKGQSQNRFYVIDADQDNDGKIQREEVSAIKIYPELRHDKWIVLTSVNWPTEDVKFLAKIPDWKVLVVGDKKTPDSWSHPNCTFLNIKAQESLGFHLTSQISYGTYQRKNLGYLFAIAHGAKIIYETDDDNRPLDMLKSFHTEATMSGLMYARGDIFNPYRHFGQSTLWPRGYPLGQVGRGQGSAYRVDREWKTPSIQQGIVNGDPDMDAIFRLTRKKTLSKLDVTFDKAAPSVILPEGVFSPFNSQNTLFLYEALWAMYLPTTTTFRMCDIWRGYWAQRLLWEIGGRLAFFPPNAYQQRNAHSYMADAEDEKDMYFNTQRLIDFLIQWKCPSEFSFFQCVHKLSLDMAEDRFWGQDDAESTRLWLTDLVKAGYEEPARVSIPASLQTGQRGTEGRDTGVVEVDRDRRSFSMELQLRKDLTLRTGTYLSFVAAEQIPPSLYEDPQLYAPLLGKHAHDIATFCEGQIDGSLDITSFNHDDPVFFQDVLLIVIGDYFNERVVKSIEIIYHYLFPNIAYCGYSGNPSFFTFINIQKDDNKIMCLIQAMEVGYNVTGYLVVGQYDLLNPWNFFNFDKTRVWVSSMYYRTMNLTQDSRSVIKPLKEVDVYTSIVRTKTQSLSTIPAGVKPPYEFSSTLIENTKNLQEIVHDSVGAYYIPSRLKETVLFYLDVLSNNEIIKDIVDDLLLYGLEPQANLHLLNILVINKRNDETGNAWAKYSTESHIVHPLPRLEKPPMKDFCSVYLLNVLNRSYPRKTYPGSAMGDSMNHTDRK